MKPIRWTKTIDIDIVELFGELNQEQTQQFLEETELLEKGSELDYVVDCIPEVNASQHPGKSPQGKYSRGDLMPLLEALDDKGWMPKQSLMKAWQNCEPGDRLAMLSQCEGLTADELMAAVQSSDSSEREAFFSAFADTNPEPPTLDQVIAKLEDWKTTNPNTLALVLKSMGFKQETAL